MSTIKIYWMPLSSPSRAVVMCAKTMGLNVELKLVNLMTGENRTPEYLQMNPQHTVPVVEDGKLILTESRAALQYFAGAYAPDGNDTLYPKDVHQRAMVDQMLFFDATCLYKTFSDAYYVIFREKKRPEESKLEKFEECLGYLEGYLTQTKFSASDNFTIADFTIVATLSTILRCDHDMSKFPKIISYLENCKLLIKDYEEFNAVGAEEFGSFLKGMLKELP